MIPTIVTQALTRDVVELGATAPTRDFLYVEDTAAGIAACAAADGVEGEVINLGTGARDLDRRARRARRSRSRVATCRSRSTRSRLRPPDSEVERLVRRHLEGAAPARLGAAVDLDEGLRRTIDWLSGSLEAYKPSLYNV